MKEAKRHLKIAIAEFFYAIGKWFDAQDAEDIRAKIRRLDPDFEKSGEPNTIPRA
jgi:hypothetical protein